MLSDIIVLVAIPVVRSITGWAENAFKDGKVSDFEINQLLTTVVRVGIIGGATYLGLNELGFDVSGLAAGSAAFVADFVFSALKKK